MPNTELTQQQHQALEQTLSTRQLQALEFLQLPVLELQERISEELANNPLLESVETPLEEPTPVPEGVLAEPVVRGSGDDEFDAYAQSTAEADGEWRDDLPIPGRTADEIADAAARRSYFFDHLAAETSFQEQMLDELKFAGLSPVEYRVAEMLVGCIDDNGYLTTPLADVAMSCSVPMDKVEKILTKLQSAAPAGIGARDLSECLALQLKRRGETDPKLYELVAGYLDELGKNHQQQVAKALDVSLEELQNLLAKIRNLKPHPGAALANTPSSFVTPELSIIPSGGGYAVDSRRSPLPRLHISERYEEMLSDPSLNSEDRAYIRGKLNAARELMRSLDQRKRTIERIAEVIAAEQSEFFDRGVDFLRPMTMAHVAGLLDLHEATISRAIANKYVQTPRGLFDFRYFFSGGFQNESGEEVSTRAIREKIRGFVAGEDPRKPLSDDKLSEMLKLEGFSVARRTVAKYRDELRILPSHLRRRHI